VSGDDRDERPRKSWREIDRARDGTAHGGAERRPRGAAAEARSRQATKQYLEKAEGLFASDRGGAAGEALARAIRDAHGTPDLPAACAAYRDALGYPSDPGLAAIFLDSEQRELVVGTLEALAARPPDAWPAGLRSQLRLLAEHADDEIAGAAEDLLQG
jgi:hypothetical protein